MKTVGLLALLAFGGCVLLAVLGSVTSSSTPTEAASSSALGLAVGTPAATATPKQTLETQLKWLPNVLDNCHAYKHAPNQIKKSAVFRKNEQTLRAATVDHAVGTLQGLSTNEGGSELRLSVTVGDVDFATESFFSPIKRGSKVYNQAADLTVGQCVRFSAKGLKASSFAEESKVCDPEYFARFTEIGACK